MIVWVGTTVPPRPGADTWPHVLAAAELMLTTVCAGTYRACREQDATRLRAGYILDLLLSMPSSWSRTIGSPA